MSANPSEPTEQEANIPLDDIIKKLAETVEKLTDVIEKAQKRTQQNTNANKDWHKFQSIMKIELEKEHGRQVRLNKEYARTSQSLEMFTGLLSRGVGVGLVFKSLTRSIGGVSKELDKYKAEHKELMRMEQEFAKKGIKIADLGKAGNEQYQEQFRRQQEAVDTAKEGAQGKGGKLAEGISSMKAFADKHKTGILIGAGSIGILLTVLKKAFDVSPMFQAIKKLLHFGFMLILRPIGDFFGFIMRPIMVMMLRKFIIPWYKDVYPVMKKLGTWIGNQVVPTVEKIFTAGTAENAAAIVAAATIPAVVIAKKIIPKIIPAAAATSVGAPIKAPKAPIIPAIIKNTLTKIAAIPATIAKAIKVPPTMKLPAAIIKPITNLTKLPAAIIKSGANIITKGSNLLKNAVAPMTKSLTNPKILSAAADLAKIAPKVLKFAIKPVPIVGWTLAGIDAAGSAMKEYAPEQYEGIRQGALGLGKMLGDTEGTNTEGFLDFMGFGTQSTAEQIAGHVKPFLGDKTGVGGGAGSARSDRSIIVNIGTVNENADALVVTQTISNELAKQNKKSPRT